MYEYNLVASTYSRNSDGNASLSRRDSCFFWSQYRDKVEPMSVFFENWMLEAHQGTHDWRVFFCMANFSPSPLLAACSALAQSPLPGCQPECWPEGEPKGASQRVPSNAPRPQRASFKQGSKLVLSAQSAPNLARKY